MDLKSHGLPKLHLSSGLLILSHILKAQRWAAEVTQGSALSTGCFSRGPSLIISTYLVACNPSVTTVPGNLTRLWILWV